MAKKNKKAPLSVSAPIGNIPAARVEFAPDYANVKKDLTRIGVLAGIFFAALIALSFILPIFLK